MATTVAPPTSSPMFTVWPFTIAEGLTLVKIIALSRKSGCAFFSGATLRGCTLAAGAFGGVAATGSGAGTEAGAFETVSDAADGAGDAGAFSETVTGTAGASCEAA